MDYEKKYNEALERARELSKTITGANYEYIFPELKETEDEKIRKIISDILLIDSDEIREILDANNVLMQDINAWLEKQGEQKQEWNEVDENECNHILKILNLVAEEQETKGYNNLISSANWLKSIKDRIQSKPSNKPQGKTALEANKEEKVDNANKVEPKFKVGDWITDGNITIQIEAIKNDCYLYCGDCALYSIKTADKVYHLWTIEDAQDGDILYTMRYNILWSYKDKTHCNYSINLNGIHSQVSIYGWVQIPNDARPACKEQRDLLSQKLKESGYEWDNEKKQVITLNHFVDNNDMVEPKFHVGDWIVYKDAVWKVCNIALQDSYELLKINNEVSTRLIKDVDENAHLWTINDAKPGDIIYAESKFNTFDFIAIFSEIKNKNSWEYCSVDSDSDDYSDDLDHWEFDDHKGFVALDRYNFYPATKKQRHLLYQKMKDAGYEWDAEKKELKDL